MQKKSAEVICTVTYIQASKLCRALKKKCAREQGEMALGKNKPCCYFCDINLPCILQLLQVITPLSVTNWRLLSWKSRPREQFENCLNGSMKEFSEWIYRRIRIISRTRSRATHESSEKIYRGRFDFVNSSETFQHLCGFQETRWENGQNIFTWTTLCLQRIILEIRRGFN